MQSTALAFSEKSADVFRVKKLVRTESTNEDLKLLAAEKAADGTVLWALEQTAGKGRQGRRWASPPGNLYFSLLLYPSAAVEQFAHYNFLMALAVHRAVSALLPQREVRIKWPNDVLLEGKKICGILLEADVTAKPLPWLVIGCGLNVRHHPAEAQYPVTSLRAAGLEEAQCDLEDILHDVLSDFHMWRTDYEAKGFGVIRKAWLERAHGMNMPMAVRLPQETIQGIGRDLDAEGRLLLELPNGAIMRISAGDVFFG